MVVSLGRDAAKERASTEPWRETATMAVRVMAAASPRTLATGGGVRRFRIGLRLPVQVGVALRVEMR